MLYEPFNLNDYLGHLMVVAIFAKAALVALAIPAYKLYLKSTEPK